MHLRPLQQWRVFAHLCVLAILLIPCGQGGDVAASADIVAYEAYDVWGFEEYQAVVLGDAVEVCHRG